MAGVENISQYCTPALNIPEQINLQYAASAAIVVGFVTYEPEEPVYLTTLSHPSCRESARGKLTGAKQSSSDLSGASCSLFLLTCALPSNDDVITFKGRLQHRQGHHLRRGCATPRRARL